MVDAFQVITCLSETAFIASIYSLLFSLPSLFADISDVIMKHDSKLRAEILEDYKNLPVPQWIEKYPALMYKTIQQFPKDAREQYSEYEWLDKWFTERLPRNYKGTVTNEKFNPPVHIVSLEYPFFVDDFVLEGYESKLGISWYDRRRANRRAFDIVLARPLITKLFKEACYFNDRVVLHFTRPPRVAKGGISYEYDTTTFSTN
jgi:hypothetical protein